MSDRIGGIPRAAWVGLPCVNELPMMHSAENFQALEEFLPCV